ncbi:hypothetical protein BsWGS_16897 [Bradybaena similaris]
MALYNVGKEEAMFADSHMYSTVRTSAEVTIDNSDLYNMKQNNTDNTPQGFKYGYSDECVNGNYSLASSHRDNFANGTIDTGNPYEELEERASNYEEAASQPREFEGCSPPHADKAESEQTARAVNVADTYSAVIKVNKPASAIFVENFAFENDSASGISD